MIGESDFGWGDTASETPRAFGGVAIPRGSEVVITAYADGFATVQPWGEFLAERDRNVGGKLAVPAEKLTKEA